jgi:hypothetical protein
MTLHSSGPPYLSALAAKQQVSSNGHLGWINSLTLQGIGCRPVCQRALAP